MGDKIIMIEPSDPDKESTRKLEKKKKSKDKIESIMDRIFGMEKNEEMTMRGILLGTDMIDYEKTENYGIYGGILAILAPLVVFLLLLIVQCDNIDILHLTTFVPWFLSLLMFSSLWIGVVFKFPSLLLPFRAFCGFLRLTNVILMVLAYIIIAFEIVAFLLGVIFVIGGYISPVVVTILDFLSPTMPNLPEAQSNFVETGAMIMGQSLITLIAAIMGAFLLVVPFAGTGFLAAAATKFTISMGAKAEKKKETSSDII